MIRCLDDSMIRLLGLLALLATWHAFWARIRLLGMALGLISEALGISWAWAGSRTGPGTTQWAGLHSRPGGHCFSGIQGSRARPKVRVICRFWALLSIYQLSEKMTVRLTTDDSKTNN